MNKFFNWMRYKKYILLVSILFFPTCEKEEFVNETNIFKRFNMNFKQFLLLEMPHFTIANKSYDLFAEKDKSVFKNVIKIFRNYSKSDIQKLFQQNRFLILFLKNHYKSLSEPKKAEVNNKFKNSGLGYVVDLIS